MKLFRYHKDIDINIDGTEILDKLKNNLEKGEPTFINPRKKPEKIFRGIIKNNSFEISRTINGRNSALPLIQGRVEKEKISLDFSLFPIVEIFGIVFGIIINLILIVVLIALKRFNYIVGLTLIDLTILLMFHIDFWIGYRDSLKEFKNIIS